MLDFYQSIDYYLCTSWHEGTPNPCLEAASCGVPLITTRVGNMPELVDDRENSFLISSELDEIVRTLAEVRELSRTEQIAPLYTAPICSGVAPEIPEIWRALHAQFTLGGHHLCAVLIAQAKIVTTGRIEARKPRTS